MSYALSIQPQTRTRAGSQPEDRIVNQAVHRVEVQAERSVEHRVGDDSRRITDAIAHGDSSAFGLFYDAWFTFAFDEANRYTQRDEATCLDIVQDAMLKAARSMQPLESPSWATIGPTSNPQKNRIQSTRCMYRPAIRTPLPRSAWW